MLSYRKGPPPSRWTTSRETSSTERRERANGAAPSPRRRSAPDAAEARSDAPKSFAGSLLVPADMLPPASSPDEDLKGNEQGRAVAAAPRASAGAGDRAPAVNGGHQNPFLVPEAARVEHRSRLTRRRMLAALLCEPTWVDQRSQRSIPTAALSGGNTPLAGRAAPGPAAGACGFDGRRGRRGCDRHTPECRPSVIRVCCRLNRAGHYAGEWVSHRGEQPVRATDNGPR